MHGLNELPVLNRYSCLALERRRSRPGAIGPCKGAEYSQAGLRVFNQRRRQRSRPGAIGPCKGAGYSQAGLRVFNQRRRRRQACRAEAEWTARRDRL